MRSRRGSPARRLLPYFLVILYFAVIDVIDHVYWADQSQPLLYAIPMVAFALIEPPLSVGLIAIVALILDSIALWTGASTQSPWPVSTTGLAVIGCLSILIANRLERAREREQRHEEMIELVQEIRQPLTVIKGYVQRLQRNDEVTYVTRKTLAIVERSAHELETQVARLLNLR